MATNVTLDWIYLVFNITLKKIVVRVMSVLKANRVNKVRLAQFKMIKISFITSHVQQDPIAYMVKQQQKLLQVCGHLREH